MESVCVASPEVRPCVKTKQKLPACQHIVPCIITVNCRGFLPSPSSYFLQSGDQIAMESKSINQTAIQGRSEGRNDVIAEPSNDIGDRQQEPRFGFMTYGTTAIQVIKAFPLEMPPDSHINHFIAKWTHYNCYTTVSAVPKPNISISILSSCHPLLWSCSFNKF